MSEMWNERMFVVVTRDEDSNTMQAIAGFTLREDAQAFSEAQHHLYMKDRQRVEANERLRSLGDALLPERWLPSTGKETSLDPRKPIDRRKMAFFISEVAWNPHAAPWPLTEQEIMKGVLVLQDPNVPPYTPGDTLPPVGEKPTPAIAADAHKKRCDAIKWDCRCNYISGHAGNHFATDGAGTDLRWRR